MMSKEEEAKEKAKFTIDLLEKTEIPNLKRMLFNADTLITEMTGSVQQKAIKDAESYRNSIEEYDKRIKSLKKEYKL